MTSNFSAERSRRIIWRFCYWIALAAIFAWAVWQRFVLPLDPIADPDTWGYIAPALRKLTGAEFGHTHGRNFIYPGFVFLLLHAFGNFRAITIVQHLLGVTAGALLLLTWRDARIFVSNPRLGGRVYDSLGLMAAAIFLLARQTIHLEMELRPEALCAFLFSLNIWLLVRFAGCWLTDKRPTAAVVCGVGIVFTAILFASLKPSFVLVAVLAVVPVAVFFFRRDVMWHKAALASGAIASATLLLLPEHFLSRTDEQSRTFLPATLFVIHANLIRDQMADDLQRGATLPYSRDWLARVHTALSNEIAKSAAAKESRYHVSAGFSPDYLMYQPSSIAAQLRREFGGDVEALCTFYRFYYWRIWLHRPVAVLQKIARQMSIFYAPICPAYDRARNFPIAEEYERGATSLDLPLYRQIWMRHAPAVEFISRTRLLTRNAPVIEQPASIRKPLGFLAVTYLPLLFVSVGLSAFVLSRETHRRRFGWLALLVVLLFTCNVAACLEVAVVHLLEYRRYMTVQMYFTLLAQFFALWFVAEMVLETRCSLFVEK